MSAIRLTFLYPHLFRSIRLGEAATQCANSRCRKAPRHLRSLDAAFTTTTRAKEAVFERHGKAVEPHPPPLPAELTLPRPGAEGRDAAVGTRDAKKPEQETEEKERGKRKGDAPTPVSGATPHRQPDAQEAAEGTIPKSGPLEAVLHMPPPERLHHPHISTPPYVHHFDSYTLVKQLEASGYTKAQAITAMKAVRSLLAQNLDVAQDGLVSKSDVENETYLFRAACSELSTEIKNNRRVADEQSRQQRTLLQHEVDILTQKLTQDLLTLKDDVRGMFSDRKMEVREGQRRMESAVGCQAVVATQVSILTSV
jgi:hypothetical protein